MYNLSYQALFVLNFVLYVTYWKSNHKMIFYLRNGFMYYSKVGDIKTIKIRCLKANRKNTCLFLNLRDS